MKSLRRTLCILLAATIFVSLFSGCTSLLEEDPNSQQLPWAGPADWENNVPGMPNGGF